MSAPPERRKLLCRFAMDPPRPNDPRGGGGTGGGPGGDAQAKWKAWMASQRTSGEPVKAEPEAPAEPFHGRIGQ